MTKPAMSTEEALMRSHVNLNAASAIHTQTMVVRELENIGLQDLAQGARNMLAKMLEMPEQAPAHTPSEQASNQMSPAEDTAAPVKRKLFHETRMLTQPEVEVAALIKSRLFKVLQDLPSGHGYHTLTVEELFSQLDDELVHFHRHKQNVELTQQANERADRINDLLGKLMADGVKVVLA